MSDIIWRPTPEIIEHASVTRLMRRHGIADYGALIRRSTDDTDWFWRAALEDLGVVWDTPYDTLQDCSRGFCGRESVRLSAFQVGRAVQ